MSSFSPPQPAGARSASWQRYAGLVLLWTCIGARGPAPALAMTDAQRPTRTRPADLEGFMQKLGMGTLTPHAGASQIPAALNTGERYAIGGALWEPTTVSAETPAT
jgi:hypothetical protein